VKLIVFFVFLCFYHIGCVGIKKEPIYLDSTKNVSDLKQAELKTSEKRQPDSETKEPDVKPIICGAVDARKVAEEEGFKVKFVIYTDNFGTQPGYNLIVEEFIKSGWFFDYYGNEQVIFYPWNCP